MNPQQEIKKTQKNKNEFDEDLNENGRAWVIGKLVIGNWVIGVCAKVENLRKGFGDVWIELRLWISQVYTFSDIQCCACTRFHIRILYSKLRTKTKFSFNKIAF